MSKVVYRKNGGRRRAGYPLLVLCAVLLFGFSLVNLSLIHISEPTRPY